MKKIYSHKEIMAATILGGPIATGWLMAHNYKAFKETNNAVKAWLISISSTVFLLAGLYWLDSIIVIPRHLVPVTYIIITHFIIKKYQDNKIGDHLHKGGDLFSGWRVFLISLIVGALTIAGTFGFDYALEKAAEINYTVVYYGKLNNEIKYQNDNVSNAEANAFGKALSGLNYGIEDKEAEPEDNGINVGGYSFMRPIPIVGYSHNYGRKNIVLDKINGNYELTISIDGLRGEQLSQIDEYYSSLRRNLQGSFPKNKIIVNLMRNETVVIRIES